MQKWLWRRDPLCTTVTFALDLECQSEKYCTRYIGILKFTRRCLANWVDRTTMGYHLFSARIKDGTATFLSIFFNGKMSCISQPPDFPVSDWKIERNTLWWMSISSAFAWITDFLDCSIVFSTFSADLIEKIGCHKFQQPYFGNHVLGCL